MHYEMAVATCKAEHTALRDREREEQLGAFRRDQTTQYVQGEITFCKHARASALLNESMLSI